MELNEKEQRLLASLYKHKAYMEAYNKRPEVQAKRRVYNKQRWQELKGLRKVLKEEGLI